jgi:hypothetical protein
VARHHLEKILPDDSLFPSAKKILHFEGRKGPDAIKRKSPAQDEPWHYYSPFDDDDSQLIELIEDHYKNLVKELKEKDAERVAFEAAWLAHAIVDGLTPAHHYPYEETLEELRGESIETRTTIKKKLVIDGDTRREKVRNNWKVWGPRGLMTVHGMFEFGVATIIAPLSMNEAVPSEREMQLISEIGPTAWFKRAAREIAVLDMYDRYRRRGWSTKLVYDVRHKLGPTIVQTLCLVWYAAIVEAGLIKPPKKQPQSAQLKKKQQS